MGEPAPGFADSARSLPRDEDPAGALILTDACGRVTFANAAAERMFGWSRTELVGRVLHEVVHRACAVAACALLDALVEGRALEEHEDVFVHRDGSRVLVRCSNAPVVHGGRMVAGALAIRPCGARCAKPVPKGAPAATPTAGADPRACDHFVAMLAHELRNPLAAISGAATLLRRVGADGARRERALDILERQVRVQARLVDDLLEVARIRARKLTLRRERLDFARVVADEVEERRASFEAAGIALELERPGAPVWVDGDAIRLAQVAASLLENAVKFTDRGGSVRVAVWADEGAASVRVRDTGVGIEPALLPRIFDAFVQADLSLERTKGGLGLGLTLAKELVELHGGEVRAVSGGCGCGAEFVVRLPLAQAGAQAGGDEGDGESAGGRRVLLIEDNADVAETLAELLEIYGHSVEIATNGTAGLAAFSRFRPDVVLCDVGLPGMSGYDVARALRRDGASRVQLVALTGYVQAEDRAKAREAGFDHHLSKPVTLDALRDVLAT